MPTGDFAISSEKRNSPYLAKSTPAHHCLEGRKGDVYAAFMLISFGRQLPSDLLWMDGGKGNVHSVWNQQQQPVLLLSLKCFTQAMEINVPDMSCTFSVALATQLGTLRTATENTWHRTCLEYHHLDLTYRYRSWTRLKLGRRRSRFC